MPANINVKELEWDLVRRISIEYNECLKDENKLENFKHKYSSKVFIGSDNTLLIKRVKVSAAIEPARTSDIVEEPGIENLEHSFMVMPDQKIIVFGRKHEGAALGAGTFGKARNALIRDNHSKDGVYPTHEIVIKTQTGELPVSEIEILKKREQFFSSIFAKTSTDKPEKSYIAQKLHKGQPLGSLVDPSAEIPEILIDLITEEKSKGIDDNMEGSLQKAIKEHIGLGKVNPLYIKIDPVRRKTTKDQWDELSIDPDSIFHKFRDQVSLKEKEILIAKQAEIPSVSKRLALAIEVAIDLKAMHETGLLHRDIKGSNSIGSQLLTADGKLITQAALIDYGLSCEANPDTPGRMIDDKLLGTKYYLAPEILQLEKTLSKKDRQPEVSYSTATDLYALGKTIASDLGLSGLDVTKKLLSNKPDDRPDINKVIVQHKKDFISQVYQEYKQGKIDNPKQYLAQYLPDYPNFTSSLDTIEKTSSSVNVKDTEWVIVSNIIAEYNSAKSSSSSSEELDKFKVKYGNAVQIDSTGNLVLDRIKSKASGHPVTSDKIIESAGITGLEHKFIVTQKGIIAIGRKHEGAFLGKGSYGSVRLALLKTADGADLEQIVVKDVETKEQSLTDSFGNPLDGGAATDSFGNPLDVGASTDLRVDLEKEGLEVMDQLHSIVTIKDPKPTAFIAQKLQSGYSVERLSNPKINFRDVVSSIIIEEKKSGLNENSENTLQRALKLGIMAGQKFPSTKDDWDIFIRPLQSIDKDNIYVKYPEVLQIREQELVNKKKVDTPSQKIAFGLSLTEYLMLMHTKGLLHNDIKGANTIGSQQFSSDGELFTSVQLVDMGSSLKIGRNYDTDSFSSDGSAASTGSLSSIVGEILYTPEYKAPELPLPENYAEILQGVSYSVASDSFSLGKTFQRDLELTDLPITKSLMSENPADRPELKDVKTNLLYEFLQAAILEYKQGEIKDIGKHLAQFFPEYKQLKTPNEILEFNIDQLLQLVNENKSQIKDVESFSFSLNRLLLLNPRLINANDASGLTPLMLAASSGNQPLIKLLISKGANPEALNNEHKTAYDLAKESGHDLTAKYLQDISEKSTNTVTSTMYGPQIKDKAADSSIEPIPKSGQKPTRK